MIDVAVIAVSLLCLTAGPAGFIYIQTSRRHRRLAEVAGLMGLEPTRAGHISGRPGRHLVEVTTSFTSTTQVVIHVPKIQHLGFRSERWLAADDMPIGAPHFDHSVVAWGDHRQICARTGTRGRHLLRAFVGKGGVLSGGLLEVSFSWDKIGDDEPYCMDIQGLVTLALEVAHHFDPEDASDDDKRLLQNVSEGPTPTNRRLCFDWIADPAVKVEAARAMLEDQDLANRVLAVIALEDTATARLLFDEAMNIQEPTAQGGQLGNSSGEAGDRQVMRDLVRFFTATNTPEAHAVLLDIIRRNDLGTEVCLHTSGPGSLVIPVEDLNEIARDTTPAIRRAVARHLPAYEDAATPALLALLQDPNDTIAALGAEGLEKVGKLPHVGLLRARAEGLLKSSELKNVVSRAIAGIQARSQGAQHGGLTLAEGESDGHLALVEPADDTSQ